MKHPQMNVRSANQSTVSEYRSVEISITPCASRRPILSILIKLKLHTLIELFHLDTLTWSAFNLACLKTKVALLTFELSFG